MRASFLLASCFALGSPAAVADQLCNTAGVPITITNWSNVPAIPRFDPVLGTLNSITVTLTGSLTGSIGAEAFDNAPTQYTSTLAAQMTWIRPDLSGIVVSTPSVTFVDNFAAYDGTLDFRGPSGVTHSGLSAQASAQSVLASPADLALFTGPAGNPGVTGLQLTGMGVSSAFGPGPLITQFATQAGADLMVCYDYTPLATSYCAGDGTATSCPCGNASALGAGQGCLNSTGAGAHLAASGTASVANDSLVLTCSGVPATATTLFFQGTAQQNGGNGAIFGDGLRCAGGTVARLRIKFASGGVATYPQAGDAPISVTGSVPASAVRHYQTWYRNAAAFCTPATFNLSQGLRVQWSP